MSITATRLTDYGFYNPETNTVSKDQLRIYVDHPDFETPLQLIYPFDSSTDNGALLGSNLITSSGWTSTGWTGNESIGWTHTAGNTSILSNTIAAIISDNYQIQVNVSGRTLGSFVVAFGGDTSPALIGSNIYTILASSNGNLTITPTTDFDGTILISIKAVVFTIDAQYVLDLFNISSIASEEYVAANYVAKVSGSSLISDTEIARLLTVKQNPFRINLPSGNLTTKIAGATFEPTGWATIEISGTTDAVITHTLTGRKIGFINVFEIDGSDELVAKPFSDAYSGFKGNGSTVSILGVDTTTLPLRIELIFN